MKSQKEQRRTTKSNEKQQKLRRATKRSNVEVDPKYADDITFVRTDESKMNQVESVVLAMLEENNLFINTTKTEKIRNKQNLRQQLEKM